MSHLVTRNTKQFQQVQNNLSCTAQHVGGMRNAETKQKGDHFGRPLNSCGLERPPTPRLAGARGGAGLTFAARVRSKATTQLPVV